MKEIINWVRSYQDDPTQKFLDINLGTEVVNRWDDKTKKEVPVKRYEVTIKSSDLDRSETHCYYSFRISEKDVDKINQIKSLLRTILPAVITTPPAKD